MLSVHRSTHPEYILQAQRTLPYIMRPLVFLPQILVVSIYLIHRLFPPSVFRAAEAAFSALIERLAVGEDAGLHAALKDRAGCAADILSAVLDHHARCLGQSQQLRIILGKLGDRRVELFVDLRLGRGIVMRHRRPPADEVQPALLPYQTPPAAR